jgi:hypothetical protein
LDTVQRSKITGGINLVESKSTSTASLTRNQKRGFPLIEEFGGTVVGKAGGTKFPTGTIIPPTKVNVFRPKDWANDMLLPLSFGGLANTARFSHLSQ